ncbi:hypothetical protein EOL70_26420 [Leucothrix sargassi]|nr:hypothetical protein EOL70_26420 [Leucothrix sargassi]
MVPAHSKQLNLLEIFTINTETNITGVTMTTTVKRKSDKSKLKGLGFFGLMAMGSHHQPHHLMIATGLGQRLHH